MPVCFCCNDVSDATLVRPSLTAWLPLFTQYSAFLLFISCSSSSSSSLCVFFFSFFSLPAGRFRRRPARQRHFLGGGRHFRVQQVRVRDHHQLGDRDARRRGARRPPRRVGYAKPPSGCALNPRSIMATTTAIPQPAAIVLSRRFIISPARMFGSSIRDTRFLLRVWKYEHSCSHRLFFFTCYWPLLAPQSTARCSSRPARTRPRPPSTFTIRPTAPGRSRD